MLTKPRECENCSLEFLGKGFSRPEGTGELGVAGIGEGLGYEEMLAGLPFRPNAQAGSKLEECIKLAGTSRDKLLLWNIIACQPPSNELRDTAYGQAAMDHCKVHFNRVMKQVRPKGIDKRVYIAFGAIPTRELTGMSLDERGFVLPTVEGRPEGLVVPTFHPSFLRRGAPELTPLVAFDIQRALDVASGKFRNYPSHPDYVEPKIQEFPNLNDAWSYYYRIKENQRLVTAFDIETPKSGWVLENERDLIEEAQIFQIQFAVNAREAIVFPWKQPYLDVVVAIMKLPNVKAGHNAYSFDVPRLEQAGVVVNGITHDTMWCLRGDSKIRLADGTFMFIRDIVEQKLSVSVATMNDRGEFVYADVVGWHKTEVKYQKWVRIRTSYKHSVILTPEHKVWTQEGWKEAQEVREGDRVRDYRLGSEDFIHGTLLGDGHINSKGTFHVIHGPKQKEYIEAKARHLGREVKTGTYRDGYKGFYVSAMIDYSWRTVFYPEGQKIFLPPPSNRALAVWYMDDWGWYIVHRRHKAGYIKGSIAGFANGKEACDWVEEQYGVHFTTFALTHISNQGIPVYQVTIRREGMQKFFLNVREFVHPSMYYKLPPEHRGFYNGWMEIQEPQWTTVTTVDEPYPRGGFSQSIRYCITVDEPTHRFFTSAGLVANCFKHWHPRLPRGLQSVASMVGFPFPWKHFFGERPQWYGGCDVIAVHYILRWLPEKMKQLGVWQGYLEEILEEWKILKKASNRGVPVSEPRRLVLGEELKGERKKLHDRLQVLIPEELKNVRPRRKQENGAIDYGYIREPKQIKEARAYYNDAVARRTARGLESTSFDSYVRKRYGLAKKTIRGIDGDTGEEVEIERWVKIEEFKSSSKQLIGYLEYKRESLLND